MSIYKGYLRQYISSLEREFMNFIDEIEYKIGGIMPRESKNRFDIHGDIVHITHPDWNFTASASIRVFQLLTNILALISSKPFRLIFCSVRQLFM